MSTELRPSTENSIDQPPEKILNDEVDFTIESWVNYTGLKIKEHNEQELEAFKKPFLIGWQRELSIRAQLHSSGKRIVDISYISPCKQTRLKSYIELGVYLRNDQSCQLEPENFTFAKQPVYKYPEEIIKQLIKVPKPATSRSNRSNRVTITENGGTQMPQLTPYDESREMNSSIDSSLNNSVAEGRSKRKRTAPSRFDDEDYLESLNKKKLIKTTTSQSIPTTPTSKSNNSTSSITPTTKLPITPFSPKNEVNKKNDKQDTSEDKESNSSFKSSKSRLSDQHNKQQLNSNVQLNNSELEYDTVNNLKENDELESKNKINDNLETTEQQKTDQPAPRQKRKYVRTKPRETNSANSLLINQVNNILQNGNFECEDNDLSEFEMNLPVPLLNNDQLLPIPPCSLICGQNAGDLPTLLCSKCLCLFHPHCVKTGIFLKETKEFVCPNCMQPDDLDNAIEDSTVLFEQANDNEMNNEGNIECLISESSNQSETSNQPILSQQLNKISSIKIAKHHNSKHNYISGKVFIPNNRPDSNNLNNNIKTNGLDNKKSKQIRLPTNLIRNLSNLSNNNNTNLSSTIVNSSNKTKINQQKNLNQLLDKSQLIKTINQLDSRQQDLKNLRSNYNQLANGMQTNSSFASRKTHLESMNKSIQSSKELIEIFKKVTASGCLNGQLNNRANQIMMMNRNNNVRFNSSKNDDLQQSMINNRLKKYYDYLNQKQTGLKQMIDQYQALDKIFDYLNVRDLIQCKLVNKTFNRLANEKHHWKKLNLKNLIVNDWNYFSKIVDDNQSEELCLENLRLPNRQQTSKTEKELRNELWKEFRDNYPHFQTLNRINFGKISVSHLSNLLTNVNENDDFSNPLYDLEELSVKNLYDDENDNNQSTIESNFVSLKKLDQLVECKNLRYLRIESKQGISNDELTINFLNNLSESLPQLKQLYLPSLRGFTLENFEFLTKLNQLEVLEIGSCESWTSGLIEEEDEEMDLDNNLNNNLEDNQSSNAENSNDELIEINKKRNSIKKHKGAFKYLNQLRNLKKLHLVDVIIDEMECNQLPICLENMTNLESLGLSCTVSPDATQTLNMLCNTLKTKLLNLKSFQISTEDPHTNFYIFELLLKRLNNLQELKWLVGTQVEDNGECLVPFIKERGMESDLENEDNLDLTVENDCIERFETCYLNDILHKQLNDTKIFILPQ